MYQSKKIFHPLLLRGMLLIMFSVLLLSNGNAQRPKGGGGGGKKPANVSKPGNAGKGGNAGRGSDANKPSNIGGGDRNGGNKNAGDRNAGDRNNVSNSGNRDINAGNKNNVGNKVNVDNSKKNVNINVDNSKNVRVNNSRNTAVRRNVRPYPRPPYVYGGRRYMCYHPFVFHPFHPFIWGPMWHPWGFFIATLATTAIILSVDNGMAIPVNNDLALVPVFDNSYYPAAGMQTAIPVKAAVFSEGNQQYDNAQAVNAVLDNKDEYYYDQGVYYLKADGGYTVVSAPLGATIKTLPSGYETITLDDDKKTKNYYYGGTFYEKSANGYTVVAPTAGSVVEHVSEGGEETKIGDITYVKMGDTYYQPIKEDGKDMYEVANVEDDK